MIHQEYLDKGWAPIPLPKGDKFPPPSGTTGNIAALTKSAVNKLWKNAKAGSNMGLRLQDNKSFGVISLDVDHYDEKRGDAHLSTMEQELGSLDRHRIPRSTRRGVNSPSAQFFFRVPAGMKWKNSACSDVDIVQMTHRYAAVYPSVVDDQQYTWYLGSEEIEVPHTMDLPELPERWVSFLKKGSLGKLATEQKVNISPKSKDGYREAVGWLRDNISGWDSADLMSESLKKVSDSNEFRENLQNNGHDTMVSAIHAAVMLGVEGHQGLKSALFKIKENFMREISLRKEGSRSETFLKKEYEESVVGEVDRLINEVEDGSVTLVEYGENLALPDFRGLLVREEAAKRPRGVDIGQYRNTDLDHAEMFRDYWGRDILTVFGGGGGEEFAVFNPKTARYTFHGQKSMFGYVRSAVVDRIHFEAALLFTRAEELDAIAEKRQLKPDEEDPDELRDIGSSLLGRADQCSMTNKMRALLDQMHGFHENIIQQDDFDAAPNLIGLPGGETLDLKELKKGKEEIVRRGRQSDLMTKSTAVRLVPGATSKAWEDFLDDFIPDPELRSFVQKAIGYSLVSGNPDKKLIFLSGPSNTGKTTILESVAKALGDYAGPMNAIKLFGHSSGGPAPEMVESLSKRMVFMAEVGDDHALSANSVKRVTGNDTTQQRQLHSNVMRNAAPKFTPYVSTNSVPDIQGVDSATKERIMVIPFEEVHPRKKITEENDLKSQENSTAILWWVVEGCKRYYEEGMDPESWPEAVERASDMFAKDTSPMQNFLDEAIERTDKEDDRVGINELYQLWESWCIRNRTDKKEYGSVSDFRKRVAGNGFKVHRGTYNSRKNQYFVRYVKAT